MSTLDLSATSTDELNDLCPNSCTEISYETMSKSIPHYLFDTALISMYYQSDQLRLLEEYFVFDFTSILVAIGGLLELFLGFLFFQRAIGFCSKTIAFLPEETSQSKSTSRCPAVLRVFWFLFIMYVNYK